MALFGFLRRPTPSELGPGCKHFDAYSEVVLLARSISDEGWRKTQATNSEIALGYLAFYYWMVLGSEISGDPHHYSFPSESTRQVSEMLMVSISKAPTLVKAIRKERPGFDPIVEIGLVPLKLPPTHPVWGECVIPPALRVLDTVTGGDNFLRSLVRLLFSFRIARNRRVHGSLRGLFPSGAVLFMGGGCYELIGLFLEGWAGIDRSLGGAETGGGDPRSRGR